MNMNTALIVIVLIAVAFGLFYLSKQQNEANEINLEKVKEKIENGSGVVIDVRTAGEYADGHLKKAVHNWDVMSGEFEQNIDSLDKEKSYYLYCRSGNRSGKATKIMEQNGFENVHNIGGYQDLINAGLESSK